MKLAVVSLGGVSSLNIAKSAKEFFKISDHIKLKETEIHVGSKDLEVIYKNKKLEDYDCVYIRGSYKYLLLQRAITSALMKKTYTPLKERSFTIGHDKFLTAVELKKANIPIPGTYFASTTNDAKTIIKNVNYPIIIKIPSGTQGKGVMSADSVASAKSILDALEVFKQPYIIQEFIDTDSTDVRAIVAGNKVIAAMKRKATKQERRANFHMGGICEKYEMDYDSERVAINAAKALEADICAVDILEGNKPLVIEVNLSPGLVGITKATKKNIPKIIAKALFEKTKEFKEKEKGEDYSNILKELNINNSKEIITNLDIKAGIIKLPSIITKITEFNTEDEITILAKKGKLIIKK
jgi:ribosomal protein S6--L-glutamate ligase